MPNNAFLLDIQLAKKDTNSMTWKHKNNFVSLDVKYRETTFNFSSSTPSNSYDSIYPLNSQIAPLSSFENLPKPSLNLENSPRKII